MVQIKGDSTSASEQTLKIQVCLERDFLCYYLLNKDWSLGRFLQMKKIKARSGSKFNLACTLILKCCLEK